MTDDLRLRELSSPTLADQAYDALREAIISGELAPQEKITERGLAARLAVSPTPVREALRRLEQDQLVDRTGPRTVQVTAFDDDRAAELRLVEGNLRAVAARLAASNARPDQLARIERLLDEGDAEHARLQARAQAGEPLAVEDLADLLRITRGFHTAVNEASGNPVLLRLLSMVDAFSLAHRRPRLRGELRDDRGLDIARRYAEHRAVFAAVRDGDGPEAERLMRDHAAAEALGALT
ncbi:GntR family transcriptional regulator [Iamia majanohamensis]|uniref:GntR family transcriptional regulator n=1 Tax=Iamia majanohamensis TaxID=467976 RepID=A0AAE9Y979_9ACTN|nr:GntR family transcriptional regulator [Iamia majanohamensis]WCO68086.1 GntR family transcriptional regulator [Iamia majanohamensis]